MELIDCAYCGKEKNKEKTLFSFKLRSRICFECHENLRQEVGEYNAKKIK